MGNESFWTGSCMGGEITEAQREARRKNAKKLNPKITLEQALQEGWFTPTDGLCQCGCGEKTALASTTIRSKGYLEGQPVRYISGHNVPPGGTKHHKNCSPNCGDVKRCSECKEDKPLTEFHKQSTGHLGLYSKCKNCQNFINGQIRRRRAEREGREYREWPKTEEERAWRRRRAAKRWNLQNKFGISIEQYEEMLEEQGDCCAICGRSAEEFAHGLAVDHDHACCPGQSCGKCVRALICSPCNTSLGGFQDSQEILMKAHHYLEVHKMEEVHV